MSAEIKRLEDALVAPKEWTMIGEASYKDRPTNSLLAEDLFFDYAAKPAPIITQERTASLEDIIKQRIAKGTWDDVVRKKDSKVAHKATVELDGTKNTDGLAKVYEQQYLKTVHGVQVEGAMKKQYDEIEALFKDVCHKLDALSNFHFTPKIVLPEASIKTNAPALAMEEATPTAVSNTSLIAPQEVYHASRALKDKEEMSKDERKAHRRHRKEVAKKKQDNTPATNTNTTKADALKELQKNKNVTVINPAAPNQKTSSAKFFGKLQQQQSKDSSAYTKKSSNIVNSKTFKL